MAVLGAALTAQDGSIASSLHSGREIFQAACVGCHGQGGTGAPDTTVGFKKPSTFPDFTDCRGTSRELDVDYHAIIAKGGPQRGFSPIMPAFGEALSPEQIDAVIGYLRQFCRNDEWPRGELNLPLAMVTEKAFPEDEAVLRGGVNLRGGAAFDHEIAYERRFGIRNQIELAMPFSYAHKEDGGWGGGVGDVTVGLKRALVANKRTGSIFSVFGGAILPTGDRTRGTGTGTTVFETFAAYGQILPRDTFVQAQAGTDLPANTDNTPRTGFWRAAAGKSFRQKSGVGRMWTPILEAVADRDFTTGAKTNWDVVPQFQVTLSARQHVRAAVGVRTPVNNRVDRPTQLVFYVLWDWFDGGLLRGWK
jgi:hypothetical protein